MIVLRGTSLLFFIVVISAQHATSSQTGEGESIGSAATASSPSSILDPALPRARAALLSSSADSLIANDGHQGRSLPSPISILSSILQPIILALLFQQLQQQQQQQQPHLAQLLQQQLIQQQLVQQQLLRQQLFRQQFGVPQHSRAAGTIQNAGRPSLGVELSSLGSGLQNAGRPSLGGGLSSLGSGHGFGLGLPFGFGSSSLSRSFGKDQDISSSPNLSSLFQVPSDPISSLTRFKKSSADNAGLKRTVKVPSSRSSTKEEVDQFSRSSDGVVRPQPNLPSLPLGSATSLDGSRDPNSQSSPMENQIRFPLFRAHFEPTTTFSQTPLFRNKAPSTDRRPVQQSQNTVLKEDNTNRDSNSDITQVTSFPRTLEHSLTTFYRNLPLTKDVHKSIQLFLEPHTRNVIEFVESEQESDVESPVDTASFDGTAHLLASLLFANDEDLAKEEGTTVSGGGKGEATKRLRFPDV